MNKLFKAALCAIISFSTPYMQAQQKSWEGIHQTPLETAEKNFELPPIEFASHVIWGWEGTMDKKTIQKDLDAMVEKGFRSVIFEAGYGLPYEYLSDKWFKAIREGVLEAKKRGMKVWLIDEGKYPSGFAGGKFSRERPDLRMQALVVSETISVKAGESLNNYKIDSTVISAVAVNANGLPNRIVEIKDNKINFNAGVHPWTISLVRSDFRSAQTRAVNNPTRGKDTSNSICDYLNPEAVQQFIDWTHEQYKKYLGKELGTTVLGFRGDEPDYAHTPWTPEIINTFKEKKGYDPTPYLASFFTRVQTEEEKRVKADYWDVWSELFAINFFKLQADWCEANGLAHITHLNNEHNMPACVRAEGDFFRTLSKVQIPGVDAIWNQIWPETVNDFPKLASSVAHIYGKPRSFSESFAAYNISPTIPQAKYVVDYQIVRGINFFEFMFWMGGSQGKRGWMSDPAMKGLNEYTNRATYLMSQGKPGARIAMYYPTSTMWLGNNSVFEHLNSLTNTLNQHQRDFDYVNDDAFTEALTIGSGYFENKSGQKYYTLIIPSVDVISVEAWNKIKEFAERGGQVLFWGKKPDFLIGKSFTEPIPFPDFTNCRVEPSAAWTATVEAVMPEPEMKLQLPEMPRRRDTVAAEAQTIPATDYIRYTRRILPDAELFFIFNEGENAAKFTAEFDKVGVVKFWDTNTGAISDIPYKVENDKVVVELDMPAWDSRIISIQKSSKEYNITSYGAVGDGVTKNTIAIQKAIDEAYANGGGCIIIPEGTFLTGALFFKQGVDLNVCKGATLKATIDPADFPVISTRFEGIERKWRCAFLNFNNSKGVRVFGEGTVDGSGIGWKGIPFSGGGRPRMICFTKCDGGSISGLRLREQASWCVHVLYTNGFDMSDLDIRSDHTIPSSDGLDIDSSSNIAIRRIYIDVNDDCISIKSGKDDDGRRVARPSENILIEDCHFAYGHGGVALGSEITGCIRNVTVRNCQIDGDNWGPIRFKSQPSRGGIVENITFENITLNNTRSMLDINMEWRMKGELPPAAEVLTQLKNIRIINVKGNVRSVGTMYGFTDAPFGKDVFYFENCEISAQKGLSIDNADDVSFAGLTIDVEQGEKIIKRQNSR